MCYKTVVAKISTNINNTSNLSPQIMEHRRTRICADENQAKQMWGSLHRDIWENIWNKVNQHLTKTSEWHEANIILMLTVCMMSCKLNNPKFSYHFHLVMCFPIVKFPFLSGTINASNEVYVSQLIHSIQEHSIQSTL